MTSKKVCSRRPLGDAPYRSLSASSAGTAAHLAIALTPAGDASIGYLLVQLERSQ